MVSVVLVVPVVSMVTDINVGIVTCRLVSQIVRGRGRVHSRTLRVTGHYAAAQVKKQKILYSFPSFTSKEAFKQWIYNSSPWTSYL